MKKHKYGLTGEGFTMEEADEILRDIQPLEPMTPEEHREYMAMLRRSAERIKADMAAYEESNGVTVTREDLEREMKRQQACQDQVASE